MLWSKNVIFGWGTEPPNEAPAPSRQVYCMEAPKGHSGEKRQRYL